MMDEFIVCNICDIEFADYDDLEIHIKEEHGDIK